MFGAIKLFTYLACHPRKTTKSNVYIFVHVYIYIHIFIGKDIHIYIKIFFKKAKKKKKGRNSLPTKKERIVTRIYSKTVSGDKCKKNLWIYHS